MNNNQKYASGRVIKKFAFLPIKAGKKLKWLQMCYIKQRYLFEPFRKSRKWINLEFISKDNYEKYKNQMLIILL